MKKLLSGILMLLMTTSCIFFLWDPAPSGKTAYLYIKNSTDIPLSVSWVRDQSEYLSVRDSICIASSGMWTRSPKFNENSMRCYNLYVYDEDGNELCSWVDGDVQEGQRNFYEEEFWTYYRDSLVYIWVFDITEEDIVR